MTISKDTKVLLVVLDGETSDLVGPIIANMPGVIAAAMRHTAVMKWLHKMIADGCTVPCEETVVVDGVWEFDYCIDYVPSVSVGAPEKVNSPIKQLRKTLVNIKRAVLPIDVDGSIEITTESDRASIIIDYESVISFLREKEFGESEK